MVAKNAIFIPCSPIAGFWFVICFGGAMLLAPRLAKGQVDTRQNQWLRPGTYAVVLDTLPIQRDGLLFYNAGGELQLVSYWWENTIPERLWFWPPLKDSLYLVYRRLPINPLRPRQHKDTALILPPLQRGQAVDPNLLYQGAAQEFRPFAGLQSQGSISRGISVGNNQDAVVRSDLNLQLSGRIGEQTELRASITDNALPAQSGGYTQQLREFDRVYLELENPDFGLLRAGDYNMQHGESRFMRFDKRISGGGINTRFPAKAALRAEGGVARGRFARNRFQGQEGNQGPYRLRGANDENFIIIISGSERVYIDGILQTRGEQNQYTIDYNAGEITFTALQPITKDKRIVVEFQYTEQNYLRSVLYGAYGWQEERWQAEVRYYREQDSKNRQLLTEYSDDEKGVLAAVGDDLAAAQVNTIQATSYSAGLIHYRLRDSLGFDSVLVYTPDSTGALYQASFSYVGPQQGNYQISQNLANGRVFRWVAPQDGVPQGDYAPVRPLIAPNLLEVWGLSAQGSIGKNQEVTLELASSRNDPNLFSDLDEGNDVGLAGEMAYRARIPLKSGALVGEGAYEFNQERFSTIELLRRVEFARDWNLPFNYRGSVGLARGGLGYQTDSAAINYRLEQLQAQGTRGQRHNLQGQLLYQKHQLRWQASVLQSADSLQKTIFWREQGQYRWWWLKNSWLGLRSVGEWNFQSARQSDSLFARSYRFFEYDLFNGWGDTNRSYLEYGYIQRLDDTAQAGTMERFALANTGYLKGLWRHQQQGSLQGQLFYRSLKILQPTREEEERTLTTRLNYRQRLGGDVLTSNTFYETGAGSEPRRSFTYVEVPAGTGTYTHTDYNGNGQRELDEFEIAPRPDLARFVRVFTPNNTFVATSLLKLGQNLNLRAPKSWYSQEGWRQEMAKFSWLFNYQLNRKVLRAEGLNLLNPFADLPADTSIVSVGNNLRQTLFFNRSRNGLGGDYTYNRTENRALLTFGIEGRRQQEHRLNFRWGFASNWLLRVEGRQEERLNRSDNFDSRNFRILGLFNRYALRYQPTPHFTLTGSYEVGSQEGDATEENLLLVSQNAGLELLYNRGNATSLRLQANYIFNGFDGNRNSPAAFELLQALQPGQNATLDLSLQKTFLRNIVLSLLYNGRFGAEAFAIHTGSVEVKAFF